MTCEHETTTLLWLYGEADDGHEAHIASCASCRALVAEHADVASALGPSLGALADGGPPRAQPAPARRDRAWLGAGIVALAAAVLAWVAVTDPSGPPEVAETVDPEVSAAIVASGSPNVGDPFDLEMDDLDRELDELSFELELL